MYNASLSLGEIVTAIYKKGMREEPGDYKPVNLTSVLGKTVKIMLGAAERHLKDNALSTGIRKGKSSLTDLILFSSKVTCQVKEGKVMDLVFLDFIKLLILSLISSFSASHITMK